MGPQLVVNRHQLAPLIRMSRGTSPKFPWVTSAQAFQKWSKGAKEDSVVQHPAGAFFDVFCDSGQASRVIREREHTVILVQDT